MITAANKSEVIKEIKKIIKEKQAKLVNINQSFSWERKRFDLGLQSFSVFSSELDYKNLELPLLGEHQIINTVTALGVVEELKDDYPVNIAEIKQGLLKVNWPGRLEVVKTSPIIILDGAHNQAGAEKLSVELERIEYDNLILVLSILGDKDYQSILAELAPKADSLVLTKNNNQRAANVEILKEEVLDCDLDLKIEENLELAVEDAVKSADKEDLILIGGSLYTVAQIRAKFVKE